MKVSLTDKFVLISLFSVMLCRGASIELANFDDDDTSSISMSDSSDLLTNSNSRSDEIIGALNEEDYWIALEECNKLTVESEYVECMKSMHIPEHQIIPFSKSDMVFNGMITEYLNKTIQIKRKVNDNDILHGGDDSSYVSDWFELLPATKPEEPVHKPRFPVVSLFRNCFGNRR